MNINFTPDALDDLRAIKAYIAEFDERSASNVISRIRQTILMFSQFPLLGRKGLIEGTREFSVVGLPYVIIYNIRSETDIDILKILHERQNYP
ncbi:MAG: type II toxin-antitoxin system RelE/ParE family toxin [Methyloligellaceae bacterium]